VGDLLKTKVQAPVWALLFHGTLSFEGVLFTLILTYVGYRIFKFFYIFLFRAPSIGAKIRKRHNKIMVQFKNRKWKE